LKADRLDTAVSHLKCFPVGRNDRYLSSNPSAYRDCTADISDVQHLTAIWQTTGGHRDMYAAPPTDMSQEYYFFHHKPNEPDKKKKTKTNKNMNLWVEKSILREEIKCS
jgi:hypothetical protein